MVFFENRIFMPLLACFNMRILQLHCDHIEYTPTKKEIKSAEDLENPQTQRLEELVVVFVAIEDGDDSSVVQNAISQIKNSINC